MSAHIWLAASEEEDHPGLKGEAIGIDEASVGLPEEAGADNPGESRGDAMLGKAPAPLVAEPEDRAGNGSNGRERPKGAFAGPRKAKAAAATMEAGSAEANPESKTSPGA